MDDTVVFARLLSILHWMGNNPIQIRWCTVMCSKTQYANVHVHRPPAVTLNKTPEEFHISTGLR